MPFKTEIDSFNRMAAKMNMAFKAGAFGLDDAMQIVPDLNNLISFFNSDPTEIISRLVQPQMIEEEELDEEVESDDQKLSIPGTSHRVAKPKK